MVFVQVAIMAMVILLMMMVVELMEDPMEVGRDGVRRLGVCTEAREVPALSVPSVH